MSKSNQSARQVNVESHQPADLEILLGSVKQFLSSKSFYYGLVITVITIISFLPSLRNDFMQTWDDDKYVTGNPMIKDLSAANLRQMFTKQVNGTYVPLPLLTYAIEYKLFGGNPLPFHATNLILHLLSTLLVFRILRLLNVDLTYAFFGALLFGIHPMRVESVAWITERKDVLFCFFYLASIVMYLHYTRKLPQKSKFLWYSFGLFIGALLSKIEAVTLPVSLLLIDYLMHRPLRLKMFTEKIPFFILSLVFGAIGIFIIYKVGLHGSEIMKSSQTIPFTDRFLFGLYALTGYIVKFFVPFSQSAVYPYPEMTGWTMAWITYINPVVIGVLAALIAYSVRKTRTLAFGMLFYLVNIVFLLQIVAVGMGFFADRYTYLSYLGLIFIVSWGAAKLGKQYAAAKVPLLIVLSAFSFMCMGLTYSRCKVWKDGVSLWSDVISQYPGRRMEPYANRGISYTLVKDWDNAIKDFSTALSIGPASPSIYADRGIVYGFSGQPEKAIADFSKAIEMNPGNTRALFNRGVTYGNSNQNKLAKQDFRRVLELEPGNISACSGLSILLLMENNLDSSRFFAEQGVKLDPYRPELYAVLGNCELESGNSDKAIEIFRHCLRLDNISLDAYLGIAAAFLIKGDLANATHNLDLARQVARQDNISLVGLDDMDLAGITLLERKRTAIRQLLTGKP